MRPFALGLSGDLFSPAHMLLMLAVFSSVGLLVALMLLCSKLFGGRAARQTQIDDADIERRRRALEVERMELEILERRQRLAREQAAPVAKAA